MSVQGISHPNLGSEGLGVIWPIIGDHVFGYTPLVLCAQFLQAGLPVQAGTQLGGLFQHRIKQPVYDVSRRRETAGQVDRTDHRFEGVGEDRCLLPTTGGEFTLAQVDVCPQADGARCHSECPALTTAARSLARRPSERSGWEV